MKFIEITPENKPLTIVVGRGNIFQRPYNDVSYILAHVEGSGLANKMCLISISTGQRWASPVPVKDIESLTDEELDMVFAGYNDFVLVSNSKKYKIVY